MSSLLQESGAEANRERGHNRTASKLPKYAQVSYLLTHRSLGLKKRLGFTDTVVSSIYNSFDSVRVQDCPEPRQQTIINYQGGIFNLEFSLDGGLLVAACEGKQILLYDCGNQRLINTVENAHFDCVNCIKFLTDRSFATGSDDALIKLWDVRNLRSPTKELAGHTSWVKNIEWSEQDNVMVTSAFDGTIYSWNLNEPNENNLYYDKVFLMKGLMRMKLTPDGTKMIISTTSGYLIIIHNLNLATLATDLRSFRPDMYRLMQLSQQSFPAATNYNYLFSPSQKRNRIEFIDDFPNEAEVICSLQIHPHGWSAVSRNLNSEENEEWTAVHDIQDRDDKDYEEAFEYVEEYDESLVDAEQPDIRPDNVPMDIWMSFIPLDDYHNYDANWRPRSQQEEMGIMNSGLVGMQAANNAYFENRSQDRNKIVTNLKRLTHYVKEKNVGKGFIKVLAFSPDGRIICSPYNKGMRLLAFDKQCRELSECVPEEPRELETVVEVNDYHKDIVVSCKFSPNHYQLVTGCLGSEIKWFHPVL